MIRECNCLILLLLGFFTQAVAATVAEGQKRKPMERNKMKTRHSRATKERRSKIDVRIVGGADTTPHTFTHQVALLSKDGAFACGGSLLAPDLVLTAAHCRNRVQTAIIGLYSFTNSATNTESIEICEKTNNPLYADSEGSGGDVSLLRLCQESQLAKEGKVRAIALNLDPNVPYAKATLTATGWGLTSEGGSLSKTLQKVDVNYYSQRSCKAIYQSAVSDGTLCAGVPGGGKDACQGDSGGPLVIKTDSNQLVLVGVVSWGVGCARPDLPGVYTRISSVASWILSQGCFMSLASICGIQTSANNATTPLQSKTSSSESVKGICEDQKSFVGINGVERNCTWVADLNAKRMTRRCQLYKDSCPNTCKEFNPSIIGC